MHILFTTFALVGLFGCICCIMFFGKQMFFIQTFLKAYKVTFFTMKNFGIFWIFFVVFNSILILYNHKKFLNVLTKIFMVTNEIFKIWNVTVYVTTNFFEIIMKFYVPKMKKFTWKFSFSKIKISRISQNFLLNL